MLFAKGEPVLDPDTGENLGELELIRGRGVVSNIQSRFSVVDSSEKQRREIIEQYAAAGFGFPQRRYFEEFVSDFDQVAVGDVARRVALSRRG